MSDENFQPTDLAELYPDDQASNVQPEPTPAPEAQPEQASEPTGVTADAETPPAESESPSEDPKPETPQQIPFAAYQNERQQRQEAQDRAARAEAERQQLLASIQQQQFQQPQQEVGPDFWDDPDGFFAQREQQFDQKLEQRLATIEQQNIQRHMAQSELMMRQHVPDYEDAMQVFRSAVDAMPPEHRGALAMQMQQNDHPAKFAYDMAKQMQAMQQVGSDPAAYREQVRQELLAEMQQGQRPGQPQQSQRAPVPTSLAGVPNAAPASTPVPWQGPTPVDKLYPE